MLAKREICGRIFQSVSVSGVKLLKYASVVKNAESAADVLQAVSSSQRLTILIALCQDDRSAGALKIITGMAWPTLSQHLSKLRRAGLIRGRRDGRNIFYRCDSVVAPVLLEAVANIADSS